MYKIILQSMATRIEPWTKKTVEEDFNLERISRKFYDLADRYNIAEFITVNKIPANGVILETTEPGDHRLTLEIYDEEEATDRGTKAAENDQRSN
jgi:hypothetical protein